MHRGNVWRLTVLFLALTLARGVAPLWAADIDGNGLSDALELPLAERFKPAFILHNQRVVGPEPVRMLTRGDCLRAHDLFVKTSNLVGGGTGTHHVCDLRDASGLPLALCSDPDFNYAGLTGATTIETLILPGDTQPGRYQTRFLWEYGGDGNESGPEWREDYLGADSAGNPHVNPYVLPGRELEPTVYATIWQSNGEWQIQYYMYYPYNDWIGNHEGDWESIVVTIDSTDPDEAEIVALRYYNHESYIVLSGGSLNRAHLISGTHPVVYVGGSGDGGCGGGDGQESGASWPAHGDWFLTNIPWPCPDIIESVHRGSFIPHQDVTVEIWPNVGKIGSVGSGVGSDYFESRPCEAWKRADLRWGALESPSPGDFIPGLNVGNESPRSPLYQSHWHDLTPDGFEPFSQSLDPLFDQPPSLFIMLEAGDGGSLPGLVELEGQSVSAPYYGDLATEYSTIDVTVPDSVERNGESLPFRRWHDGSTEPNRTFGILRYLGAETLRALYGDVPCGDLPQVIVTNESSDPYIHACPAGDGDSIRLRVRFNPNQVFGPLSAESISIGPVPALGIWETVMADVPATAANNYTTTITIGKVSGCASVSVEVLLSGCPVGEGFVQVRSHDAIPNGHVDLSELGLFSGAFDSCSGDPEYDICYDYDDNQCIDLSDLSKFSAHFGHGHLD